MKGLVRLGCGEGADGGADVGIDFGDGGEALGGSSGAEGLPAVSPPSPCRGQAGTLPPSGTMPPWAASSWAKGASMGPMGWPAASLQRAHRRPSWAALWWGFASRARVRQDIASQVLSVSAASQAQASAQAGSAATTLRRCRLALVQSPARAALTPASNRVRASMGAMVGAP